MHIRWLLYGLAAINMVTFLAYGLDKYKARHKQWRMPSSSRAYPMPLAEKAAYYRQMMECIGLVIP